MPGSLVIEQLKQLPVSPGVYLMKDAEGEIIYVGKASSLRNRVRSYFAASADLTPKTERLVERVNELEFFVTNSEQEALILESNLVKRYRPHFNVRLKDDKYFPYFKINLKEKWPGISITRKLDEDGARYFGPFASAKSVKQTMKMLKGMFPFRNCTRTIDGQDPRPCLDYYLHKCQGPCIGAVTPEEYNRMVKQVVLFLEGKQTRVIRELDAQMKKAAEDLNFERAALLRDQLQAITQVIEGQKIASTVKGEQDAVAFVSEKDMTVVQVFFVRGGKLIGRESFVLLGTNSEEPSAVMASFIQQYYGSTPHIPPLIILQHPVADKDLLEGWLQSKRGARVRLEAPSRGSKKHLLDIVAKNAEQALQQIKLRETTPTAISTALDEVAKELNLPAPPERIECYDISNIQGGNAVGSMVVFEKGVAKPSLYRRFRIKEVIGANDYAMLQEVLRRRFKRSQPENGEVDVAAATWTVLPDLVLIDGGKGQLNASLEAMQETGAGRIPVAGLAKENEEIYVPGHSEPIVLPRNSPGLQLLQRLRDEAHRFALGYHRNIRQKKTFASALDSVPGIGPRRKSALLKQFGSLRGIREATTEELAKAKGMTRASAQKLKEYL